MNISQVRYFVTAAQMQNLSKAAETLHISQPALSQSISKLEQELGTPLFVRKGRQIVLNEAGQLFFREACDSLRNLDKVMAELEELSTGHSSQLTMGLCSIDIRITSCISSFASTHPETEMILDCSFEAWKDIDINQYDMLIYPEHAKYSKLKGELLWEEQYMLAVPRNHPLAKKPFVTTKDLEKQTFVFVGHGRDYVEIPYYTCLGLNLQTRALYFTNNREQHRQMIGEGIALGFTPEGSSDAYKLDPRVRLLPISGTKFRRKLMLCFKRDKHLSPSAKEFRDFMRAALLQMRQKQ